MMIKKRDPPGGEVERVACLDAGGVKWWHSFALQQGGGAEVISLGTFLSVRVLHEEGMPKKAIACRLGIDVRTVRKLEAEICPSCGDCGFSECD
jgi:hypothetical protein